MILDLQTVPKIKELSPITISRIAAGEVLERPASAIKELVENAIDAGSTEITIKIEAAGKNLILVSDNGCGMTKESLSLAVERHTTSKLLGDDLLNIQFFGFRGEALPSMGAISRLSIKSRAEHQSEGYVVRVVGGVKHAPEPVAHHVGTTVEVHDLFFATPARLKFLRTDKTEIQQSAEIIKKIALAHTGIAFKFYVDNRLLLNFSANTSDEALKLRAVDILGKEFIENSLKVDVSRENIKLKGYMSKPTYQGKVGDQYLYVNKRPVKDKLLLAAVRIAYHDYIGRDKQPAFILFLDVSYEMVDVNVHPSKTEVRFRDVVLVRDTVIAGLKHVLTNSSVQQEVIPTFQSHGAISLAMSSRERNYSSYQPNYKTSSQSLETNGATHFAPEENQNRLQQSCFANSRNDDDKSSQLEEDPIQLNLFKPNQPKLRLGSAIAQIQDAYIISQTENGVLLIDQRAANKCLARAQLKQQLAEHVKYRFSIPLIVELKSDVVECLLKFKNVLSELGLQLDYCTNQSVVVTEVLEILSSSDVKKLLEDIAQSGEGEFLNICAAYASTQSCRKMSIDEMNKLLRDVENIGHENSCSVELKPKDIEKMFDA